MLVAILGASANPDRYAYRAAQRLLQAGHRVYGVNPQRPVLPDVAMAGAIGELPANIHTLTVYVSATKSSPMATAILGHNFTRVIFNPGSENPALASELRQAGVEVIEACTLVMLSTGEFAAEGRA